MKRLTLGLAGAALLLLPFNTASAAEDSAFNVYWKDGIRLDTADKKFRAKIGGRIMADFAFYDEDDQLSSTVGKDGVEFRRARFYVSGLILDSVIFKAQYDFADGDAEFKDVYIGLKDSPIGTVKVGHQMEPFSLEQLTSSKYITFMERGLPNVFSPERNTGFTAKKALFEDRVTLASGVFFTADDFGNSETSSTVSGENEKVDSWGVSARATAVPWQQGEDKLVHLGLSFTHRDQDQNHLTRFRQRPEAHQTGRFVDSGKLALDEYQVVATEAALVYGPFSMQGEYMRAFTDRRATFSRGSGSSGDPEFSGWYLYGSYWLTGEHRNYKASEGFFSRVKTNSQFMVGDGIGGVELAVRYSELDLNDADVSGGELRDVTAGVNWHLNNNTRVMANYVNAQVKNRPSEFDGSAGADIFQFRFQIDF